MPTKFSGMGMDLKTGVLPTTKLFIECETKSTTCAPNVEDGRCGSRGYKLQCKPFRWIEVVIFESIM